MPDSRSHPHNFGELVRRRRRALDLTQAQLAERVSCSEDMVRKIEADLRRPSRWLAERLAKHLRIEPGEQPVWLKTAQPAAASASSPAAAVVGRGAEMSLLGQRMLAVREGTASLVLVEGEAGIGKSHLAQAALAEAERMGFLSGATACYEIDRAIPLQPLLDWTHRMLNLLGPELIQALSPGAQAELAELSPQVRELRPAPAPAGGAPELRRARIFGAFVELVVSRLRAAPLLIVIDDIHWADEMTLPLLHALVRQTRHRSLFVICTYRSEELAGNEALSLFVQSTLSDLGATRLVLSRWSADEVRELLDARGVHLRPELAARLYRSSEGHPLYLASMLQQLHEFDGAGAEPALPLALRDSIRARMRRLPSEARAILEIAAVLGRRFDFHALERGSGLAGGALADAVELLVQRRLLREFDDGASLDFDHHRIREVVYDDLGAARRIVLHRRAAESLADADGDNVAAIARHCELSGQWSLAIEHHEEAACRSLAISALNEATRAIDRALALTERHPEAADAEMRLRLHERSGDVHVQDGRSAEAAASFEAALALARARNEAAWTRDLLTKLGMAYRRADDYARASAALRESLAASRALNEPRRVADTLYHLGTVAWSDGDNALALRCHDEAVRLCESHALRGLVAVQAWHGDGEGHFANACPRRAMASFERSLALAREIGDRGYEAENLMMLGYCCSGGMGVADYARAERHASEGLAVAESAGQQWHHAPLSLLQADTWRSIGRTREALAQIEGELRRSDSLAQPRFGIMALDMLGRLLHENGRHAEAEACYRRALDSGSRNRVSFWRAQMQAGLAQARLHQGLDVDWEALRGVCEGALERCERFVHARCLAVLCEGALEAGDAVRAREDATRLLALAGPAAMSELEAIAHWLLARAWIEEAPPRAEAGFATAQQIAERIARPWLVWRIRSALAEMGERTGRTEQAERHRAAAESWRARFHVSELEVRALE